MVLQIILFQPDRIHVLHIDRDISSKTSTYPSFWFMHSIVLLKGIYLSVSTLEHILIKMHIPLHPWFSLEFVLLGFRVRYRSCSTQLYFGQNISYNKKNNFIKTRFPSQLRMISVRVHAELHFPDIDSVLGKASPVSLCFFRRHGFFHSFLLASLP